MIKPFHSKIILFGEYSILNGSMGLAIPYSKFSGSLKIRASENQSEEQSCSHQIIHDLYTFIKNKRFTARLDSDAFERHLTQGIYFESNIPSGYGLGSSGALVASLYHTYFDRSDGLPIRDIRNDLAQVESFFHGTSSGIDPLVSFVNRPILVNGTDPEICKLNLPDNFKFFLLDTGEKASTQGLVSHFKELLQIAKNQKEIGFLNQLTNQCIHSVLSASVDFKAIQELAELQQKLFKPMYILNKPIEEAKKIFSNDLAIKLCGSGGGGFALGIARINRFNDLQEFFQQNNVSTNLLN